MGEHPVFMERYLDDLYVFRVATTFARGAEAIWAQSTLLWRIKIIRLCFDSLKELGRGDGHFHVARLVGQVNGHDRIFFRNFGPIFLLAFTLRL